MNINGVILANDSIVDAKMLAEAGNTTVVTNMVFAKMIALLYRAERIGNWEVNDVTKYELSIVSYLQQ